jgi:hypothetical protein
MFYLLSLYLFTCNDVQQTMFVSSYSNIIGAKLRTVFVSATEHGSSAGYNSGEYRYDNVTLSPLLLQRGKSGLRVTYSYLWRVVCGPELETLRSLHRCYQWCMKCLTYPEHLRWPAAIWCGSVIFCKFYVLLVRECVFFHVFLTPFCRAISTYVYFMFRISLLFWITFYILGAVVAVMMAWSYGSWIYNYLCNQCRSQLMLWVWISIRARCTTLCDKVCQWLVTGRWFSPGTLMSFTNKTDRHNITEILLKVALNTIKQANKLVNKLFTYWIADLCNTCTCIDFKTVVEDITDMK